MPVNCYNKDARFQDNEHNSGRLQSLLKAHAMRSHEELSECVFLYNRKNQLYVRVAKNLDDIKENQMRESRSPNCCYHRKIFLLRKTIT